jgi:hypothetical protein
VFTLLFLLVFLLDREACALVIVCAQGLISHPPDFLRRSLLIFLLRASASPRSVFFLSSPAPSCPGFVGSGNRSCRPRFIFARLFSAAAGLA